MAAQRDLNELFNMMYGWIATSASADADKHAETITLLQRILERLDHMSDALTDLQASVSQADTVMDSAVALIEGISAKLAAAGTDPAALAALKTDLDAKSTALAAAISANTPAATASTPGATAATTSTPGTTATTTAPVATDPSAPPAQNPPAV